MLNSYWNSFLQILFQDESRAWIFLCLIYFAASFFFRTLFTNTVKKASLRISSKNLKALQSAYLSRSLAGWFFYLIAAGLFLLFWYSRYFNFLGLEDSASAFAFGSLLALLLSVSFHLIAYASSCLEQIKRLEDQQLTP